MTAGSIIVRQRGTRFHPGFASASAATTPSSPSSTARSASATAARGPTPRCIPTSAGLARPETAPPEEGGRDQGLWRRWRCWPRWGGRPAAPAGGAAGLLRGDRVCDPGRPAVHRSLLVDDENCEALTDLNVVVNWEHPDNGQLRFRLVHPSGAELVLSDQAGVGTSGGSALFTDEAAAAAAAPPPGCSDRSSPSRSWTTGQTGGTWTLSVDDEAAGGTGMVESWALFATCPLTSAGRGAVRRAGGRPRSPRAGPASWSPRSSGCEAVSDLDVEVAFEHPGVLAAAAGALLRRHRRRALAPGRHRRHRPARS